MDQPAATPDLFADANLSLTHVGRWAATAAPGHYDELRGGVVHAAAAGAVAGAANATKLVADSAALTPVWEDFFSYLGSDGWPDLNRRTASLARQIRDNGITYNVYADTQTPQRPWSLDLFPLIISPEDWQQIETGVQQRVRVLEAVMADVYGPQQLLKRGLLPAALVQGHPDYLRAMQGVTPVGGHHLHIVAMDLARGPDGLWWVISQRTQAPSGLGYLLENRLCISRQFPDAFESMQVQRLASTYRALIDGMQRMSAAGADAHIALLTPGPYNETYFEHAYLARYLGLTLVQGSDLMVRDQRLYLRTLQGLERIHGLIKRVDDAWLDPLELRADSTLGVPGLLQAIRAGHLLLANAPGSGFLESSALLGFLPGLSEHLLGEALQLPALPTWWCGERAALDKVLPLMQDCVIKPTYPAGQSQRSFEPVLGSSLSRSALDAWAGRLLRDGEACTLQSTCRLSQMPTWNADPKVPGIVPRSVLLRVFALSDGPGSWRVLPGGLARLASASEGLASMQRGGSSADVWVRTSGHVDRTSLLSPRLTPELIAQRKRLITSSAGENLFWLGRYTERAENSLRLVRIALECLSGEDQDSAALLQWISDTATYNTLVPPGVPSAAQSRRVFERSLVAALCDTQHAASVGFNLRAIKQAASAVRERLSPEQWSVTVQAEHEFFARSAEFAAPGEFSSVEALRLLEQASRHLAAMTGAQTDRMTRDDGWRLLSIGRHLERLGFLARALGGALETGAVHEAGGFEAVLALFDSTITFHAQYQQSRDVAALLELLVLNRDNPRSLGWVAQALRGRLSKLTDPARKAAPAPWIAQLPQPEACTLEALCGEHADPAALPQLLRDCASGAWQISDEISLRYFTHTGEGGLSLGV